MKSKEAGCARDFAVDRGLGRCPQCRYSLRGLPSHHACPECGLAYDEDTRVWRPRHGGILAVWGGLGGILAGSVATGFNLLRASGVSRAILLLTLVLILGSGVWLVWASWNVYRRGQFVCVGRSGLHYRLPSAAAGFIPWARIRELRPQRFDRLCRVVVDGPPHMVQIAGVFHSSAEVVEFVGAARQHLERHRLQHEKAESAEHDDRPDIIAKP